MEMKKKQISVGHPVMRIQTEWITIDDHLGPCKVGYIIVIEWYDVLMKFYMQCLNPFKSASKLT